MKIHATIAAAVLALAMLVPVSAQAAQPGFAAGTVNLRMGPGVKYARIAVVPAGARLTVFVCTNWCQVRYAGVTGWISARYVAVQRAPSRLFVTPFPPPAWGYYQQPWWDYQYGAWYDGRRWYWNNRWYYHPPGFSLWFRFGG